MNLTKNQGLTQEGYAVPALLATPVVLLQLQVTVISHERKKDQEVLTTSGTYPWS